MCDLGKQGEAAKEVTPRSCVKTYRLKQFADLTVLPLSGLIVSEGIIVSPPYCHAQGAKTISQETAGVVFLPQSVRQARRQLLCLGARIAPQRVRVHPNVN